MAMRRPRFKPTAILKPRRGQAPSTNPGSLSEIPVKNENHSKDSQRMALENKEKYQTNGQIKLEKSVTTSKEIEQNEPPKTSQKTDSNSSINVTDKNNVRTFETTLDDSASMPSPKPVFSARSKTSNTPVHDERQRNTSLSESLDDLVPRSPNKMNDIPSSPTVSSSNENKSKDDFDYFKSPFMSPSMQSAQQKSWSQSRDLQGFNEDIMPLSPAKVRQRIRPTPCFGIRRNSVQGNISESDDDTNKRQRHLSTSSTHSNYNPNSNMSRSVFGMSRNRTESNCSNISDINLVREASLKLKQSYRSDGFKKVSNARKELNNRFSGKVPDKTHLKMFDLIYYNPVTNPMKNPATKVSSSTPERRSSTTSNISTSTKTENVVNEELKLKSEIPPEPEIAAPVPQLKLGPDGEIILDEQSLVIETTRRKEAREALANSSLIYDDEFSGSGGFYRRSKRSREWPPEETIKFYRSLHTIGTDFSLMSQLFPNRSRKDLKLKFKREERLNMHLVDKALLYPKQFNIDELKSEFETEARELERLKTEWKELKVIRAKEKKENLMAATKKTPKRAISAATRVLTEGSTINEYEFTKPPKRRKTQQKNVSEPESSDSISEIMESRKNHRVSTPQKKKQIMEQIDMELSQNSPTSTNNSEIRQDSIGPVKLPEFSHIQPLQTPRRRISVVADTQQNTLFTNENIDTHAVDESQLITKEDIYEMNIIRDDNSIFSVSSANENHYIDKPMKIDSNDILNMDIIFQKDFARSPFIPFNQSNKDHQINEISETNSDGTQLVIYEKTNYDQNDENLHQNSNCRSSFNETNDVIDMDIDPTCTSQSIISNSNIDTFNDHTAKEENAQDVYYDAVSYDDNFEICDNEIQPINKTDIVDETEPIIQEECLYDDRCDYDDVSCCDQNDVGGGDPDDVGYDDQDDVGVGEQDDVGVGEQDDVGVGEQDDVGCDDQVNVGAGDHDVVAADVADSDELDDDEDGDDLKSLRDSLVVVASQDPTDSTKVIHEVFLISPTTGELSEDPLDLPPDVIERIVASLRPTS